MRDYKRLIKSIRSHNNREIGCYECEYLLGKKSIADPICIKRMLNDAADAIEELLAAVPHWISVEEQLPKKKVGDEGYIGYLVLSDGDYQIADYTHDKYFQTAYEFHVDGEYDPDVTHWMPLPAPPKEVEGDA